MIYFSYLTEQARWSLGSPQHNFFPPCDSLDASSWKGILLSLQSAVHLVQKGWDSAWGGGRPYLSDKLLTVRSLPLQQWENVSEVAKMSSGKFECWACTFFPSWKWAKLLKVIAAISFYSDCPTYCGTKRYKACWSRNFQKDPEGNQSRNET